MHQSPFGPTPSRTSLQSCGHLADPLVCVEYAAGRRVAGAHAERPVPGFHRFLRALLQAQSLRPGAARAAAPAARAPPGGVAFAVIADGAAQQLVHGQAERLALDVPQRHVERAQRVDLLAARRIEPGDVHLLPDGLDPERVLSDQRSGALFQRVFRAAFANARDAGVGLHGHDHVALVEELVEIRRLIDLNRVIFTFGRAASTR